MQKDTMNNVIELLKDLDYNIIRTLSYSSHGTSEVTAENERYSITVEATTKKLSVTIEENGADVAEFHYTKDKEPWLMFYPFNTPLFRLACHFAQVAGAKI